MFQLLPALFQCHYCFAGWRSSGSDSSASSPSFESFHGNTANWRTQSQWCTCQVSQPRKVEACFVLIIPWYNSLALSFPPLFFFFFFLKNYGWCEGLKMLSSRQKTKADLTIRLLEWVEFIGCSLCSSGAYFKQEVCALLHCACCGLGTWRHSICSPEYGDWRLISVCKLLGKSLIRIRWD